MQCLLECPLQGFCCWLVIAAITETWIHAVNDMCFQLQHSDWSDLSGLPLEGWGIGVVLSIEHCRKYYWKTY